MRRAPTKLKPAKISTISAMSKEVIVGERLVEVVVSRRKRLLMGDIMASCRYGLEGKKCTKIFLRVRWGLKWTVCLSVKVSLRSLAVIHIVSTNEPWERKVKGCKASR